MTGSKRVAVPAVIVVLAVSVLFGCSLLFRDGFENSGWYIKLNIGYPGAKTIEVEEYNVTGVYVEIYGPGDDQLFYMDTWYAQDFPISELIPVNEAGQYLIEVTHIGDDNGQVVEATESDSFNIQAMIITVINITPGCIGVINIEPGDEEPTTPIDLTGYWDLYLTSDGMPEIGPQVFFILQEGSTLDCSIGFTGTITGNSIHLEVWLDDAFAELDGTVSGDEIHGSFSNTPFGSGSFRLVPTTVTFSHLAMQGTVQGMTIDFDTDYAVAEFDGTNYSYSHTIQVGVGSPWAHLLMMSRELVPEATYIVTDEDWEEDFYLSLQLWDGTTYWDAISGTVWIETYDKFGMSGDFTDLVFPDAPMAGMLSGTFNVNFFESNGEVSVNGSWAGNSVDIDLTNASSDRNIRSNTGFWIWYEDQQLDAGAWLGFEGEPPPTLPWTFDDGPSIRYALDDGSGFDDLMSESGTLTLYSFSESGASGSFTGNFPGGESIIGNFDATFVEGFGIEPPD